ncbi:MAG: LysR family transcriptional regulator [Thermaerobacter sp.]|nr:LysR family transcriptional regulator [Thermaerobacter sp.]
MPGKEAGGLDLTDLRIFREVAETGSFSRAAQRLFLAQPTVSHRMASLEQSIGAQLFVRSGRGVQLTPAGALFLQYARTGLESLDQGSRAIEQYLAGRSGTLSLGCATSTATYILPQILRRYVAARPDVDVRVRTGLSHAVLDLLLARQVDLALVRLEVHQPGVASQVVLREPVLLVAPEGHRLARHAGSLTAEDLRGAPFLLYHRETDYWAQIYGVLQQGGAMVHPAMELDALEAVRAMVLAGLGLAVLPASSVQEDLVQGRMHRLDVSGLMLPDRVTSVLRRADTPFVGPVREVWDSLCAGFGEAFLH